MGNKYCQTEAKERCASKPEKVNESLKTGKQDIKKKPVASKPEVNISRLVKSNIFEPDRGKNKVEEKPLKKAPPPGKPNFKLMGLCRFGEFEAAIIVRNNSRGRGRQQENRGNLYKLKDDIGDGYSLDQINQDTAVLKNGNHRLELKLAKDERPAKATPRGRSASRTKRYNNSPRNRTVNRSAVRNRRTTTRRR